MITSENIKNIDWVYKKYIVAIFSFVSKERMTLPGMKLMTGRNGYYIACPVRKVKEEYLPVAFMSEELKQQLLDIMMEALNDRRKPVLEKDRPKLSKRAKKDIEYLEWKKRSLPNLLR